MPKRRAACFVLAALVVCGPAFCQQTSDLNTLLMQSTFKIQGPQKGAPGKTAFGTAFVLGMPRAAPAKGGYFVLITAAHVLDGISGDFAQIFIPVKHKDGSFLALPYDIAIRNRGNDLYVEHKDYPKDQSADAAALYVAMPKDFSIAPLSTTDYLATDAKLEEFEIHPGDELFCLGFPLYVATDYGFPILRGGAIASYPITPTTIYKNLLLDIRVFDGNSGGPVYFVDKDRFYKGALHVGIIQFIVGLLKGQITATYYNGEKISLASVVPARYIIETLALLPPTPPLETQGAGGKNVAHLCLAFPRQQVAGSRATR
jgi:hypothetical protein